MMALCGLIMLTYAIFPLVCVLQAAVHLKSTTVIVATAWHWGLMASPGSKSTPGRDPPWTRPFPQVWDTPTYLTLSYFLSLFLLCWRLFKAVVHYKMNIIVVPDQCIVYYVFCGAHLWRSKLTSIEMHYWVLEVKIRDIYFHEIYIINIFESIVLNLLVFF